MDGEYTGVVTGVDAETATIRLEDADDPRRLEVELELLPAGAHEAGSVLTVTVARGAFLDAEYHPEGLEDEPGLLGRVVSGLSRLVP